MSVKWETFKSHLGCWKNASVVYLDEEGTEIPIDSDWEFQEALRLAKMNQKRLNLIVYDDKIPKTQKKYAATVKCKTPVTFCESANLSQSSSDEKISSAMVSDSNINDNIWQNRTDIPPEWFIHYMKKFKKDLLYELKSSITEIVENVVKKNKKQSNSKPDGLIVFDKSETQFSPIPCHPSYTTSVQNKKKRKVSEKDLMDLTKQREVKVPKRLEKLKEKSERLKKLCNKTRVVLEEKKRLLEKMLYFKLKLDRMGMVVSDKKNVTKSASFHDREVFLFLTPGGEFTLNINIINDGKTDWTFPRLECYEFTGLHVQESSISLPKLPPMESCVATLRGKASEVVGLHHFKCILVEGIQKIGTEFTCWATVDFFEPYEKYCKISVNSNDSDDITTRSQYSVDSLIDFEKDVIVSSEKKIEENIIEIEKRLQDLDLLQSSPIEEVILKNDAEKKESVSTNEAEELETVDFDLLQSSEEKGKNWKGRLEQEEVLFGVDCLGLVSGNNDACTVKMSEVNDENDKAKKDDELESSVDSELSVICMSEEDETFLVVPLPSKSPSPSQSVHEDKKPLNTDSVDETTAKCVESDIIKINNRPIKQNVNTGNEFDPTQFSPARMRRSSLEEISESRPKKMKSESSEYRFTTANLTQPTFTPFPEGFFEKRSTFRSTGEKQEKPQSEGTERSEKKEQHAKFTFTKENEEDFKDRDVPKTDALGRVIYAVNINGYCLPVEDVFGDGEHSKSPRKGNSKKGKQVNQNRFEKRNDRLNEGLAVNILPNAFMNGASNVALLAFNTAKSVINNLQSAFVAEGKTELGKPAYKNKKQVSMEAMFKLYEMGFSNVQLNRKLLLIHDNDLMKVVEELVRMKEDSSDQFQ